ncbi:MAG: Threonyl/alanyl tRNA synthetase [Gemmatimonadetes bacterium]|nr:Threonyl/alanyl tRNA synthetase [Gemmatimonadota bacterium]
MTDRLYFADPYLTTFTATVVGRADRNGCQAVALDRTAFYPEGGGQPADHGWLDGVRVLDVQSDDHGTVWHVLEGPLERDQPEGRVDWARRFDHMQQHHGQHLLSAAFEELFQLRTVAFHLGADYATIDLDGEAADSQLAAAEERTNQVIWEDRAVEARFVTPEELATIPLRKPPTVEGAIRVVSVPGFDHSACGGTHPRTTGAVGLLHIRRREKRGSETRVEFVCGGRALGDLRRKSAMLSRIAAGFTVGLDEVEDAIRRVRDQEESSRKRLAAVMERLLVYEAAELVSAAQGTGTPLVSQVRDDLSLEEARILARSVAAAGAIAVLGLRGEKAQLLVARPEGKALDCGRLIREGLGPFGGRGGGPPAMAQGGIPDAGRLDEAVAALVTRIGEIA